MALNEFLQRKMVATTPVSVTYELTPYSRSLDEVVIALSTRGASTGNVSGIITGITGRSGNWHRSGLRACVRTKGLQTVIYTVGTGIGLSLIGLCLQSFPGRPAGVSLLAGCAVLGVLCGAALLVLSKKYLHLQPDLK